MGATESQLNPDLIHDLFWGIFKPQLIRLALQLDVFTPLATGWTTAEQVALSCHCDTTGIKHLLDYLCSQRAIERRGGLYALTPTAAKFLVRGMKAYVGDMILHYTDRALFDSIQQSVYSGEHTRLGENFVQDAWLESHLPWRIPRSLEMWQAAGIETGDQRLRILDIACGCAVKSLALAQASPDVHVTCLDSADVLDVARDLAIRMQVESQVTFWQADLHNADLGEGQFDAVLCGQITHYLTPQDNVRLFRRIYSALSVDGVLVIDCPMATDEPTETASLLTVMLWANSHGAIHSAETYRSWLQDASFRQIRQLSERWLVADKTNSDPRECGACRQA